MALPILIFKAGSVPIPTQADYARMVRKRLSEIDQVTERLINGAMDRHEWADAFDAILFNGHAEAHAMGRQRAGDRKPRNSDDDFMALAAKDGEQEYLQNFLTALEDDSLSDAQIANRARSYVAKMRHTSNEAFVATGADTEKYRWELGATEHCEDCPRIAGMSPWTKETLWTTPGGHDTECMSGCDCRLVRLSDGMAGFERCHTNAELIAPLPRGTRPKPTPTVAPPAAPATPAPKPKPPKPAPTPAVPPKPVDQIIKETLDTEEARSRPLRHEEAMVIDPKTGAVRIVKRGNAHQVDFNGPGESDLLDNAILTHNHPTWGGSFSPADLGVFCSHTMPEIRAVAIERKDGRVEEILYRLRITPGGAHPDAASIKAAWKYLRPYYEGQWRKRYMASLKPGQRKMTDDEFNIGWAHDTMVDIAKHYGLIYERIVVKDITP